MLYPLNTDDPYAYDVSLKQGALRLPYTHAGAADSYLSRNAKQTYGSSLGGTARHRG